MIPDQLPFLIPLMFLLGALVVPVLMFWKTSLCSYAAIIFSLGSALLSVYGFFWLITGGQPILYQFGGWDPPYGIVFNYDELSAFMVMVINSVAFFVLLHSQRMCIAELPRKRPAYYALVMLMMLGFNGMVLTGDLFNLYVFLEISSLASYALIAIGSRQAPVAAFRYLILGTIGGSLYLLGIGFLYLVTGSLNMIDVGKILPLINENTAVVTGLLLITVGIGVKAAVFPMHGWLPDAYTYACSTSSALIASIGTKVAAYVLIRILLDIFGVQHSDAVVPVFTILGILAGLGILYGSLMAILQTELKRMLAYSSVSQIGYIILGLSLANPMGFAGALLHILNHAVMKGCLFMVAGNLRYYEGDTDIEKMDDSFQKKYPISSLAFAVSAISMIGLPPLAGFFSKWYLVLGTVDNQSWGLLAIILISSLLNAVYFFRILEKMYLKDPDGESKREGVVSRERTVSLWAPVLIFSIALLVIGLTNAGIVTVFINVFSQG